MDKDAERASRLGQMDVILTKYSSSFPKPRWSRTSSGNGSADGPGNAPHQETILITGTTGRLGSQLLTRILAKPEVVHVYALNRGTPEDSTTLEERHRKVFRAWGLDEHVLSGEKVTFLAGDLSKPQFNLDQETFERVSNPYAMFSSWRLIMLPVA